MGGLRDTCSNYVFFCCYSCPRATPPYHSLFLFLICLLPPLPTTLNLVPCGMNLNSPHHPFFFLPQYWSNFFWPGCFDLVCFLSCRPLAIVPSKPPGRTKTTEPQVFSSPSTQFSKKRKLFCQLVALPNVILPLQFEPFLSAFVPIMFLLSFCKYVSVRGLRSRCCPFLKCTEPD